MPTLLAVLLLAAVASAETGCRVIDGDTLRCGRERIRVQGVDTPEKGQPGYEAAKERLRQLTEGRTSGSTAWPATSTDGPWGR